MYNKTEVIKVNYYYYRKSRDAAWQILNDNEISGMPVSVLRICRNLGVNVVYHSLEENELGRSVMIAGTPYILLRKDMSTEMKRYVCAHEIGHILLEHFEEGKTFSYTVEDRKTGRENGAESFAMRLIAPACVLWGCKAETAADIEKLCGVENDYAVKRLKRMKQLYKRDKFFTSSSEQQVYQRFLPFINVYNEENKKLSAKP